MSHFVHSGSSGVKTVPLYLCVFSLESRCLKIVILVKQLSSSGYTHSESDGQDVCGVCVCVKRGCPGAQRCSGLMDGGLELLLTAG